MLIQAEFYRDLVDNLYEGVYFVNADRVIIYWNRGAERITGYSREEVEGKHCSDNILYHVDENGKVLCQDSCPLTATILDGGVRETEAFLHHKDGHRLPVWIRTSPLRDGDGLIIGAVETFSDNTHTVDLRERVKDLQRLAMLDPLTGLGNRRYVKTHLQGRLDEFQRNGLPLGLAFLDIDHFKRVNDEYGHAVGDEVLRMVARTLSSNCRAYDVVGRWGGEEFVAVFANVAPEQLGRLAEKFRALISQSALAIGSGSLRVTASIGATVAWSNDSVESIIERADRLMYESKLAGRNRVTLGDGKPREAA